MNSILVVGIVLAAGFLSGEAAKKLKLPKVTGYILGGILISPELSGIVPRDFTTHTDLATGICLSFITFSVGGTLYLPRVRQMGKTILLVAFMEAEMSLLFVFLGFLAFAYLYPPFFAQSLVGFLPAMSLLLASLASPTDPSATLAVVHEYGAEGEVTSLVIGVAAFDDVLGIVNYSVAVTAATALIAHQHTGTERFILIPAFLVLGAIAIGVLFGIAFNVVVRFVDGEKESVLIILIFAFLALCYGSAGAAGLDELLATMAMGATVVNLSERRKKVFALLERYTEELIFVLFFTISGMHLNLSILRSNALLVGIFFVLRFAGKLVGTYAGGAMAGASERVRRYTAGGLIPQGGIVIGLALMMKQNPSFDPFSDLIISTMIGATVIHEILGPLFSKVSLRKAGEISE